MPLTKCKDCRKKISGKSKECQKCWETSMETIKNTIPEKTNINLRYLGALIGLIVGYFLCPVIPSLGKIPFWHIITAGIFFNELNFFLRPYAIQSFMVLCSCGIIGFILGKVIENQFNSYK